MEIFFGQFGGADGEIDVDRYKSSPSDLKSVGLITMTNVKFKKIKTKHPVEAKKPKCPDVILPCLPVLPPRNVIRMFPWHFFPTRTWSIFGKFPTASSQNPGALVPAPVPLTQVRLRLLSPAHQLRSIEQHRNLSPVRIQHVSAALFQMIQGLAPGCHRDPICS